MYLLKKQELKTYTHTHTQHDTMYLYIIYTYKDIKLTHILSHIMTLVLAL